MAKPGSMWCNWPIFPKMPRSGTWLKVHNPVGSGLQKWLVTGKENQQRAAFTSLVTWGRGWKRRCVWHYHKEQSTIHARKPLSLCEWLRFPLQHITGQKCHPFCCKARHGRDGGNYNISPASALPPQPGFICVSPHTSAEVRSCPQTPSSACGLESSRNPTTVPSIPATLFWMKEVVQFCPLCR